LRCGQIFRKNRPEETPCEWQLENPTHQMDNNCPISWVNSRYESIETTIGYYVELDARDRTEDLYRSIQKGTFTGTVAESVTIGSSIE
jgi:hypothetical protein